MRDNRTVSVLGAHLNAIQGLCTVPILIQLIRMQLAIPSLIPWRNTLGS